MPSAQIISLFPNSPKSPKNLFCSLFEYPQHLSLSLSLGLHVYIYICIYTSLDEPLFYVSEACIYLYIYIQVFSCVDVVSLYVHLWLQRSVLHVCVVIIRRCQSESKFIFFNYDYFRNFRAGHPNGDIPGAVIVSHSSPTAVVLCHHRGTLLLSPRICSEFFNF